MPPRPTPEPERAAPVRRHTLALIGLRCSGKSTVARILAQRLALPLVDLDDEIARNGGLPDESAGEVLARIGIEAYRDLEQRELARVLSTETPIVLATGGGVVERAANRTALRARAANVWLRADIDTLQERLASDPTPRPAVLGTDAVAELPALARRREPLYREVAALAIECDEDPPERIADSILAADLAQLGFRPRAGRAAKDEDA
jgi:shikimate kinase